MICKSLPFAYKGGIQTHVWELSKALIKLGHDITILTAGNLMRSAQKMEAGDPKVVFLPFIPGKYIPGFEHTVEDISFNRNVVKWVTKNKTNYDIIHAQGRSGILLSNKALQIPFVCTVHRLFPVEIYWQNHHYSTFMDNFFHNRFCSQFESKILKNCNNIITVSQQSFDEIGSSFGENIQQKVQIISNGAIQINEKDYPNHESDQLIFVGRLSKVKGITKLIDAFQYIDKKISLIIAGEGPAKKMIEHKIKHLKLEHRIKLVGAKDHIQIHKLISESYALVLPSKHESQGIVLLEANALGKPVIASNSSGMKEIVNHGYNGLLFKPDDVLDLAAKINDLYENPSRAALMGKTGKEIVAAGYSWEKIAESTLRVYKKAA